MGFARVGATVLLGACTAAGAVAACSSSSSTNGDGPDASSACSSDTSGLVRTVLAPRCGTSGCHSGGADPAASLDLVSADLPSRVADTPARECGTKTLVVPGNPEGSYLFEKVDAPKPACGEHMPLGRAPLSAAELDCLRAWIRDLPPSAPKPDAGDAGPLVECLPGLTACGTDCADTQTDPKHCGGCDGVCAVACAAGVCVQSCPGSTQNCSGACVDTTANDYNCGSCGTSCVAQGKRCVSSACTCGASVSFASQVQPIFTASCTGGGCHSGGSPRAGMSLETGTAYAALVNAPSTQCTGKVRVVPGQVAQSYLMNKLLGYQMCAGTKMPKATQSLAASEIDLIRAWICNGAPNN
jgi:hypothetical protein